MAACLRCGKQLGATAKICSGCGYPVKIQQAATVNQTGNAVPSQTKPVVCLRCGKELRTGVKFCSTCGYPTQRKTRDQQKTTNNQAGRQEPRQQTSTAYNANGNAVPPEMMTRDQLIAEIDRMMIYFSQVQNLYDEFEICVAERNAEQDKRDREYRERRHDEDDLTGFFDFLFGFPVDIINRDYHALADRSLVWCVFLSIAAVFMAMLYFVKEYFIFIAIGCFLLSGFLCYLTVRWYMKAGKGKREARSHMDSVLAKLKEHHRNYGNCLVSVNNSNPRVLRKVRDYLVIGKANTLKEALILACN